jgi:TIR domain
LADIALCYERSDIYLAETIAGLLGQRGYSVFWDRELYRDREFDRAASLELELASAILVLWSASSVASPLVSAEAGRAAERGRLVAAVVGRTPVPFRFRATRTIDLVEWCSNGDPVAFGDAVEALGVLVRDGAQLKPRQPITPLYQGPNGSSSRAAGGSTPS